jgi:hypothetical protein
MPDFRALLSKPVDDIVKPKAIPTGTFVGRIDKYDLLEAKNERKTPYVRFSIKLASPGADIDPSELDGVDLSKKTLPKDFYLTDDALHRLKSFMSSCGIDFTGRSLAETIPDFVGAEVTVYITQRTSEDGKEIYNDVKDIKGAYD